MRILDKRLTDNHVKTNTSINAIKKQKANNTPLSISCPGAGLGPPHPSLGSRLPAASGAGPLPVGPRAWS